MGAIDAEKDFLTVPEIFSKILFIMKNWKHSQIKQIQRINNWLEAQIADALTSLGKCADGSHTMDILEDRIFDLRRMKDSIPKDFP